MSKKHINKNYNERTLYSEKVRNRFHEQGKTFSATPEDTIPLGCEEINIPTGPRNPVPLPHRQSEPKINWTAIGVIAAIVIPLIAVILYIGGYRNKIDNHSESIQYHTTQLANFSERVTRVEEQCKTVVSNNGNTYLLDEINNLKKEYGELDTKLRNIENKLRDKK